MTKRWNPYYVSYAYAHGNTPKKMIEHDTKEYPGGKMCGFTLWMSHQKQMFFQSHPECFIGRHIGYPTAWKDWLSIQAEKEKKQLKSA